MAIKDSVGSVRSTLNYFKEGFDEYRPLEGEARAKEVDSREVEITDMKTLDVAPTLHEYGFEVCPFKHEVFDNILEKPPSKEALFKAVGEFVKDKLGATRVVPFQFTMRGATRAEADAAAAAAKAGAPKTEGIDGPSLDGASGPIAHVHIDQHWQDIPTVMPSLGMHGGLSQEEIDRLLKTRFAIVNAWKPLLKPVTRDPLCVCDVRTVDRERDAVRLWARTIYGDSTTSGVRYDEGHKWYFYDGISQDQVLFLKIFDSQYERLHPGRSAGVPHTGFDDPRYKDEPARTSMEIRCMVFWEDQPLE